MDPELQPSYGGPRFNPALAPLGNAPAPPGALTSPLTAVLYRALEPGLPAPLVPAASGPPRLGLGGQLRGPHGPAPSISPQVPPPPIAEMLDSASP